MNPYFSGLARRTGLGKSQAKSQKAAQGVSSPAVFGPGGIEEEVIVETSPVNMSRKSETPEATRPITERLLSNSSEIQDVDRREHSDRGTFEKEEFESTGPGQGSHQMEDVRTPDSKNSEPLQEQKERSAVVNEEDGPVFQGESRVYKEISLNPSNKDGLGHVSKTGSTEGAANLEIHSKIDGLVSDPNKILEIETSESSSDSRTADPEFRERFEKINREVSRSGENYRAKRQYDSVAVAQQDLRELEAPQPRIDVHIGKVILDVRQDPLVAAPEPQVPSVRSTRERKSSFSRGNLSRHYLRGY